MRSIVHQWLVKHKIRYSKHQTKLESTAEVITSHLVGYVLDVMCVLLLYPIVGLEPNLVQALGIAALVEPFFFMKAWLWRRLWVWIGKKLRRKS